MGLNFLRPDEPARTEAGRGTKDSTMRTNHRLRLTLLLVFGWLFATPLDAQQQLYRTVEVDGVTRQFLVYLPVDFDASEQMPVLFHYHGGDGSPEEAMQYEIDFRSLADADGFIAVYPAAMVDPDGCTCWNGEGPYSNGIDEIGFTSAMIDAMVSEFNVDASRLYASGFSLGGSEMYDLFCYLGDRFAAIASIAANMWEWTYEACEPAAPTAFLHILGTNDFYAPYNGNEYSISVAQQNAYLASVNGAESTSTDTDLGGGVTEMLFEAGESCRAVVHYRRQGGGHDIPGFARTTIWSYVSQYDLDGLIECSDDSIPGDFNGDSIVDGVDLSQLLGYWGTSNETYDINGDLIVDGADLTIVLANWSI